MSTLDFMVIGLPRSGTTWAANWLTSHASFCVHDPLWTTHYADFDRVIPARAQGKLSGISCTGIWRWHEWLATHPAKKLVLHRSFFQVQRSLAKANLPVLTARPDNLEEIDGMHVDWDALFDPSRAAEIWEWLIGSPFDAQRHAELRQMKIEPSQQTVRRDTAVNRALGKELERRGA